MDKAFLIHYRFKSTEELINKYKRGYRDWFGKNSKGFLKGNIEDYFEQNKITLEKINFIEKELKINLIYYRIRYYFCKIVFFGKILHCTIYFIQAAHNCLTRNKHDPTYGIGNFQHTQRFLYFFAALCCSRYEI